MFSDEKKVAMLQNGLVVFESHQADVREKIEEMLLEKLDFTPSLQEDTESGEFLVYLHTDSFEDLDEEEIERLEKLGITDIDESSTESIKSLFNLDFKIVGDWVRP